MTPFQLIREAVSPLKAYADHNPKKESEYVVSISLMTARYTATHPEPSVMRYRFTTTARKARTT